MSDQRQIVEKVRVTTSSPHFKQIQTQAVMRPIGYANQSSPVEEAPLPEIDPDYVNVNFSRLEAKHLGQYDGGCLLMKTIDAKKIGLMVGDVLTITLVVESQK